LIFLPNFRKKEDNTYQGTTWQIKFNLDNVNKKGSYKLRVALASATYSELQVTFLNSFCIGLMLRKLLISLHNSKLHPLLGFTEQIEQIYL